MNATTVYYCSISFLYVQEIPVLLGRLVDRIADENQHNKLTKAFFFGRYDLS